MADKTTELERIYTIPLRKTKDLVRSRRADLAVRDVKRYLSQHMKSESIWLDNTVNELLWSHGKYSIPSRIRVRATRFSDGVVEVTLPEATTTGSIRETLAERREKAAEAPVLKAPETEGDEHGHGPGAARPVTDVKGIGPATAEKLDGAEIRTLHDLMHAQANDIANIAGVPAEKAQSWIDDAEAIVSGETETADVKAQPQIEADLAEAAKEAESEPAKADDAAKASDEDKDKAKAAKSDKKE